MRLSDDLDPNAQRIRGDACFYFGLSAMYCVLNVGGHLGNILLLGLFFLCSEEL